MDKIKVFFSVLVHFFAPLILIFITVIFSLGFSGKYSYSYFSDPALAIFFTSIFLSIILFIIVAIAYIILRRKTKKFLRYTFAFAVLVSVLACMLITISYGLPAYGWEYNKEYSELLGRSGYERSWDNRIYINNRNEFIGFGLKSPSYNSILDLIPIFVYEETIKGVIKDGILFGERESGEFWRIYPSKYACRTKINEDHEVIAYDCAGGHQELAGCKEFMLDDGSFVYPWSCKPLDLENYNLKVGDNVVLLGRYGYPGGSHCEVCFEILEEVQTIDNYQLIIEKNLFQKQERLADWKTYTNKEIGFEIKYPSDWYAIDLYTKDKIVGGKISSVPQPLKEIPEDAYSELLISGNLSLESFNDYISKERYYVGEFTINDLKAYKVKSPVSIDWYFIQPNSQKVYKVGCDIINTKENGEEYIYFEKLLEKIVYTFKFIEQKSETASSIKVISPNGGEIWQIGTIHDIIWQDNVTTLNDIVKIVLETATGDNILGIITQTVDTGSYQWNTTLNLGMGQTLLPGNYKIYMCKGAVCDSSDNYFIISN